MYVGLINALGTATTSANSMGLVPLFLMLFMGLVLMYGAAALKDGMVPSSWQVSALPAKQGKTLTTVSWGMHAQEWDEHEAFWKAMDEAMEKPEFDFDFYGEESTVPYWNPVTGEWEEATFARIMEVEPYESYESKWEKVRDLPVVSIEELMAA